LERAPTRSKAKASYISLPPTNGLLGHKPVVPWPDTRYLNCVLTFCTGQQAITVTQRTRERPSWHVSLNTGVSGDRARYRGQGTDSIGLGHNYDGTKYLLSHERPDVDAEVILSEAGIRDNRDIADWATPWDGVKYPRIYHWYTWEYNTGYYWHTYN